MNKNVSSETDELPVEDGLQFQFDDICKLPELPSDDPQVPEETDELPVKDGLQFQFDDICKLPELPSDDPQVPGETNRQPIEDELQFQFDDICELPELPSDDPQVPEETNRQPIEDELQFQFDDICELPKLPSADPQVPEETNGQPIEDELQFQFDDICELPELPSDHPIVPVVAPLINDEVAANLEEILIQPSLVNFTSTENVLASDEPKQHRQRTHRHTELNIDIPRLAKAQSMVRRCPVCDKLLRTDRGYVKHVRKCRWFRCGVLGCNYASTSARYFTAHRGVHERNDSKIKKYEKSSVQGQMEDQCTGGSETSD
ncbi:hypothetical protein FGB62_20g111 [Gracilaria domingensis]|nr:hypothetical protein FGB62_20g111 [Gracilaria domingensis]